MLDFKRLNGWGLKFAPVYAMAGMLLSGCETAPVQDSGFLEKPEMMKKYEMFPVQRAWRDPDMKALDYDKMIVRPVFTQSQVPKSGLETANMRTWLDQEDSDTAEFAKYMENAFREALKKSKRIKLVEKPGPGTMVLELNLVKVVPGKPVLGAVRNLSNLTPIGFMVAPLKMGASSATDSPMQASVAIEGRICDSLTHKTLAMFADREKQNTAFFNLNDFRAYGNPKQIIDEWAAQFVEILDKRPLETGEKVDASPDATHLLINY